MSDKTLIIGPSWVGDMVMAQALFKAIKAQYPRTAIDVLAPPWSLALTERMPEVNHGIAMPLKHGELNLKMRYVIGKRLRSSGYQRCFVLPNSLKSALIPFWAKIPTRIGYAREGRSLLLNQARRLQKERYPKMVERYIALAFDQQGALPDPLFKPALVVKPQNVEQALTHFGLTTNKPILVLCPGAEFGPSKRWPADYYAVVANRFLTRGWQIWILGSDNDAAVAQEIAATTVQPVVDLTGRTQLAQAIDLMSVASLVVTNDSGLMHIAAALDRPLLAIYGSTSPAFTPPLTEKVVILQEKIACSPCFKRCCPLRHHQCMQQLKPERVVQAAQTLCCV